MFSCPGATNKSLVLITLAEQKKLGKNTKIAIHRLINNPMKIYPCRSYTLDENSNVRFGLSTIAKQRHIASIKLVTKESVEESFDIKS
ncbi:hypothetical protein KUL49_23510 [Alteromonas sp. KUL49]|nr:hypothetical protein KUL49_23510 [Alteromonas sp. KUL49]